MSYSVPLRVAISGSVDVGKCLSKGTSVKLADGSCKGIENVEIGDVLLGDDFTPRNVVYTVTGRSPMYRVKQKLGMAYIVNKDHLLSLRYGNVEKISLDNNNKAYVISWWQNLEIRETIFTFKCNLQHIVFNSVIYYLKHTVPSLEGYRKAGEKVDIPIQQFLGLSKKAQQNLFGYQVFRSSYFSYRVSKLTIEPLPEDDYYGVTLTGTNQRFQLADATVTHNSSFLGVLKSGQYDDGKGSSRHNIMYYPHEKESGRTSSSTQRTVYLDGKKIIFVDLPGHVGYLRTTLYGLTSHHPHISLILVEGNKGITPMTKEHIIGSFYLGIPFILVITKIDVAEKDKLRQTISNLKVLLKPIKKLVYEVKKSDDVNVSCQQLYHIVPLFQISNVLGDTVQPPFHLLTDFLKQMNTRLTEVTKKEPILFIIDKGFKTDGYPLIGSGFMRSGEIKTGDRKLYLGPIHGEYTEIDIRFLHDDDKNPVSHLRKEEMGCVAFKAKQEMTKNHIRSGMIITNQPLPFTNEFLGEVEIFSHHHTTLSVGSNVMIHCGSLKRPVIIREITNLQSENQTLVRGGDYNMKILFSFLQEQDHYVRVGDRFIFREGKCRGSGIVREIYPRLKQD